MTYIILREYDYGRIVRVTFAITEEEIKKFARFYDGVSAYWIYDTDSQKIYRITKDNRDLDKVKQYSLRELRRLFYLAEVLDLDLSEF